MLLRAVFLCFALLLACDGKKFKPNLRPTIGVVSQKTSKQFQPSVGYKSSYIAASYVKYLEMAGAQVVPIIASWDRKKIQSVVKKVNGVLFPGGAAPFNESNYWNASQIAFEEAKNFNEKGIYYPLFGICLGFETLHELAAEEKVLENFDSENITMSLNLTVTAFKSRMFKDMSKRMMQNLMFENITLNMHQGGISPDVYNTNKKVNSMYRVLSSNHDRKGKEFISTIEGHVYPFYGTQWHPEKNIFEWTEKEVINHAPMAIEVTQYFANFFVNEARRNHLTFKDDNDLQRHLIIHYQPVYSGGVTLFEQIYVFRDDTDTKKKRAKKQQAN